MLPVQVFARAPFPPHICVKCGSQNRQYLIDLGINLEVYYNPAVYGNAGYEGAIYICNECWDSLVVSVSREIQMFLHGTMPWEKGEEPTYQNTEELIDGPIRLPERSNDDSTDTDANDPGTESNSEDSEPDDSQPTDGDPELDSSEINGEERDGITDFRGFFGTHG